MPLTKRSLALPASPASVKLARAWVGQILTDVGREDLVFGAQLGVSELVTNAILHAQPPLTVRVRGTQEHPRVEVSDHSATPLRLVPASLTEDVPTTFGRGLALVALNSLHWGWNRDPDGIGKTVWFEPAAEMHESTDLSELFHQPEDDDFAEPPAPPADSLSVVLLDVPAQLFGQLRRYHFELRRELRLLSLAAPERYPIAVRVTETFARADDERRASSGVSKLDSAIAQGLNQVDLEYAVPVSTPDTMASLGALFEEVKEFFAEEQLLAVAPTDELQQLQTWYLNEFVRQGRGEEPIAWTAAREREHHAS